MPNIKDLDLPADKLDELANYLIEKFRLVQQARQTQIDDKATNWQKNYDAMPAQEVRTVPFYRAANFIPQLIRMHSDILGARILGIMFGTKPFWNVRSLLRDALPADTFESISLGMNYLWENDLAGFEAADKIINDSIQTGTLTLKSIWSDDTYSYMDQSGDFKERIDRRMQYDPVPFEDFWPYPITARSTRDAEILYHRIRLTKMDVEQRKKNKKWSETAAGLMMPVDHIGSIDQAIGQSSGINLTKDVIYAYSSLECWLNWDIGGKLRPIVVMLNPMLQGKEAILKAYYNFMPYGEPCFTDFRPMPRKGSYYGYSAPEILEQSQEEQAQIHNARRDANMIANVPTFKKKRYADVPNPATDWYPGFVFELDEMDDLEAMVMGANYNSMIDEEQFGMSLAERYIGISPSMQGFGAGQSAGKRGVYTTGGTLALLSEGNKRMDIYIRRARYPFHRVGRMTANCYNQFAPDYWDKYGETGANIRKAFGLIDPASGGILYDLSASDASSNREVDRTALLQMANVATTYYQRITEAAGALRQLKPDDPMAKVIRSVLSGASDLFQRLLFNFDIGDRKRLVPDIDDAFGPLPGKGSPDDAGGPQRTAPTVQPAELESVLKNIAASTAGSRS